MTEIPSTAISIWLEGSDLCLGIDDQRARVPLTESGIACLIQLLRDRQTQVAPRTIGTEAKPTQWDLLRKVKEFSGPITLPKSEVERRKAQNFLDELMED